MGGAFGGKETQGNLPAAAAALASRLTGRAVKCRYDRDDDMMVTGKRHDFRIDYYIGFASDGRIHGLIVHQALRCGMSYDLSQAIADRAMLHADNCYFIPHIDIHSYRCKTHTQSNTAFRGFGGPQGMLGMERMIEAVARDLGLDPLIVRQRNFYPAKDALVPDDLKRTPYGMVVSDCIIHDLVDELATSADYHARRAEIARANANSTIIKRGLSLTPVKFGISFTKTEFNQAGALIHIYTDGSVHLNHGGTEMGQGLFIKVAQVVADIFGLGLEAIQITATRTDKVPNTSATAASSGSDLNGKAAQQAATILRDRLTAFLSTRHGVASESISFADGKVQLGAEGFTFQEVIAAAYAARISLSATGFYATPKIQWDRTVKQGRPFLYFAYGAAISEVAIDTLTGESRLLRVDILHDVGKSLNPAIDRGQIEGGFVQGAGWLTFEELVHDQQGRLLTHAPSTYKIPTCGDRAIDFRLSIYERGVNEEPTIHQSKAVGEPPLMLAHSVFLAIMDAIAQTIGREPDLHAPATPERVLAALEGVS
jgi:xanthine dehydrogenase large subunit